MCIHRKNTKAKILIKRKKEAEVEVLDVENENYQLFNDNITENTSFTSLPPREVYLWWQRELGLHPTIISQLFNSKKQSAINSWPMIDDSNVSPLLEVKASEYAYLFKPDNIVKNDNLRSHKNVTNFAPKLSNVGRFYWKETNPSLPDDIRLEESFRPVPTAIKNLIKNKYHILESHNFSGEEFPKSTSNDLPWSGTSAEDILKYCASHVKLDDIINIETDRVWLSNGEENLKVCMVSVQLHINHLLQLKIIIVFYFLKF